MYPTFDKKANEALSEHGNAGLPGLHSLFLVDKSSFLYYDVLRERAAKWLNIEHAARQEPEWYI
jgi:hypothetical protein